MKSNKLFRWIYGLFMLLPMLAIGVKCLYVSLNKNAYQSYSGNTKVTEYVELSNNESLPIYDVYFTFNNTLDTTSLGTAHPYYYISDTEYIDGNLPIADVSALQSTPSIRIWKSTNSDVNYVSFTNGSTNFSSGSYYFTIKCTLNSYTDGYGVDNYFYRIVDTNGLDNAMFYAIDEFNQCGFNKVDFVSFFDFFNTQNNIYITFANTYINYMLFVSLAFFIPRVLMWFVGYAYGLTDGFSGRKWW